MFPALDSLFRERDNQHLIEDILGNKAIKRFLKDNFYN